MGTPQLQAWKREGTNRELVSTMSTTETGKSWATKIW